MSQFQVERFPPYYLEQLEAAGTVAVIGASNVYAGDERVGAALDRASADALAWVARQRAGDP